MNKKFHDVHASSDGVFNAASGKLIDINNPNADMICIEDIAQALSKICRFGGHSNDFYSVAQHSVVVANLAPAYLCKEALLHDAAEAYLGDVIKPLKNIIGPVYEEIEARFMKVICDKFDLSTFRLTEVKEFDKWALSLEHEYFIKGADSDWFETMDKINICSGTWSHTYAKTNFMKFYRLFFQF
jgi:5'-deoxynucleotidase YfbR-like HD superfamily hydrolase